MQSGTPVDPRHHLEVGAVEAVHPDHTGLGIEVALVGVGGVQVVFKHSQPVQVFNLTNNGRTKEQKCPPCVIIVTRNGNVGSS